MTEIVRSKDILSIFRYHRQIFTDYTRSYEDYVFVICNRFDVKVRVYENYKRHIVVVEIIFVFFFESLVFFRTMTLIENMWQSPTFMLMFSKKRLICKHRLILIHLLACVTCN